MNTFSKVVLVFSAIFLFSVSGFAEEKAKEPTKDTQATTSMTPELKKDMAEMYSKMGACMQDGKSMEQCQKDIMKDCPVMKKTGHCPLMEGMKPMMMGKGKMMKGMDHSKH